jgi:hypothetical protein
MPVSARIWIGVRPCASTLARVWSAVSAALGGVDMNAEPETLRLPHHSSQEFLVAGVGSVRGEPGCDPSRRRTVEILGKGRCTFDTFRPLTAEDGPREGSPRPGSVDSFDRPIHVKVVVGDGRHASLDHLRQPELHTPENVVGRKVRLQWPDVLVEPGRNIDILGQATEDPHRHVRVGVDESWDGQHLRCLDDLVGIGGPSGWRHLFNSVGSDQDVVVPQNLTPVILALENINVLDQQVTHSESF